MTSAIFSPRMYAFSGESKNGWGTLIFAFNCFCLRTLKCYHFSILWLLGPCATSQAETDCAEAATESARLCRHRSGREELPHVQGQGWRKRGATPRLRSGGCAGAGGLRGATPRSRSGGVAVRRFPSSKVRSSGCTLLEQL